MSARRIMDIEVLRAIAVLGVLFHHLQGSLFTDTVPLLEKIHAWAQPWWGVDLFFAISGFVIARSLIPALRGACELEAGRRAPDPRCAVLACGHHPRSVRAEALRSMHRRQPVRHASC